MKDDINIKKIAHITGRTETEINTIYEQWVNKKGNKNLTVDITLLAHIAGISESSISNFINKRYRSLSQEKIHMLEQLTAALHYIPSRGARLIKSSKRMSVTFVASLTDGVSTEFFLKILKGTQQEAKAYEYTIDIYDIPSHEQALLFRELPFLGAVDGVIVVSSILMQEDLQRLHDECIPVVLVNPRKLITQSPVIYSVFSDVDSLKHLFDFVFFKKGYKNPVLVSTNIEEYYQRAMKVNLYYDALREAHISIDNTRTVFIKDYSIESGGMAFREIYDNRKQTPDIILCLSDILAISIQQECRMRNIKVGITGYADMNAANLFGITTIDEKLEELGKVSFQKFYVGLKYMEIHHTFPEHEQMVIKSYFIPRDSC